MTYKAVENKSTFQNRKGLEYEIKPLSKWAVIDENTYYVCFVPDYVDDQKEKAELIARLLTEELG